MLAYHRVFIYVRNTLVQPNEYGSNSVTSGPEYNFYSASMENPSVQLYSVQQKRLISQENIFSLGLGFIQKQYEYFTVQHLKTDDAWMNDDQQKLLQFQFFMHPDIIEYQRQVYTIWELFGDIGGLLEVLIVSGSFFMLSMTTIFGSGLDMYLIQNLYYT